MATKIYSIPYNSDHKRWDPLTISSQVLNRGNQKTLKLDGKVQVEDAPSSAYPALTNSVLLLEETEIVAQIEEGDVAKIHLRLNDDDPRIGQILAANSRFKLKVTLLPDPGRGTGTDTQPGPPVEGIAEVVVQIPQVWNLTFRKQLWDDTEVIDLNKVEGVNKDALQALGDWGGTLFLQPKGRLTDEGQEDILSTKVIESAGECVLDRGNDQLIRGEWDNVRRGYVFEIPASQEGDAPAGAGGELVITPWIAPSLGWARQFRRVLKGSRKIGARLAEEVPGDATAYVRDCLDHLAERPEQELIERRMDLNTWVLNTAAFIEFMDQASEMFNKGLGLFDEAFKRFLDNMVNFAVELIFALFDVLDLVFKSASQNAKTALKGSTKEMVEELSEKTIRELAQQRELVEQGVRASREGLGSLDRQIADVWARWPTDIANPTPEVLRQMDTVSGQAQLLMRQRDALYEQLLRQKKELVDVQANITISQEIKQNAGQATEKAFLDNIKERATNLPNDPQLRSLISDLQQITSRDTGQTMAMNAQVRQMLAELPPGTSEQTRQGLERLSAALVEHTQAIQAEVLIDLNKQTYQDLLEKGPLGSRMKQVHEQAQKAKAAAEAIRYQNMAWEHYQGFFSPLWWFMDWSLAQILWLHDLAREWIPGLAMAENLLAICVDTVVSYMMSILNAMIDFMNSHQWVRSCINSEVRGRGKSTALANGINPAFFDFPKSTQQIPEVLKPRTIVAMGQNGSPAQMQAVRQQILTKAAGSYQQERSLQRQQAGAAFTSLCRKALDARRLAQPAPEHLHVSTLRSIWSQLAGPMVQYEQGFAAANAQGTDYVWSAGRFMENSTFQDWDGAIEWLTWAVAWGLRLGGVLAVFTGFGVAAVPGAFAAAQGAEWIGALLRPAVSWLGTMPDIIAFQYDVIIAAALAFEAATEGNVDLDHLIVPSEYAE